MILGLSIAAFTLLHVIVSLAGIGAGLIAVFGLMGDRLLPRWTALFLIATTLTSVTGFLFPFHGVTPAITLGVLSLIVLLLATVALYAGNLAGGWRGTFVISALLALYFNVFVLFCAALCKGSCAQGHRAYTIVARFWDHPVDRLGGLCCADDSRIQAVPRQRSGMRSDVRPGFARAAYVVSSIREHLA